MLLRADLMLFLRVLKFLYPLGRDNAPDIRAFSGGNHPERLITWAMGTLRHTLPAVPGNRTPSARPAITAVVSLPRRITRTPLPQFPSAGTLIPLPPDPLYATPLFDRLPTPALCPATPASPPTPTRPPPFDPPERCDYALTLPARAFAVLACPTSSSSPVSTPAAAVMRPRPPPLFLSPYAVHSPTTPAAPNRMIQWDKEMDDPGAYLRAPHRTTPSLPALSVSSSSYNPLPPFHRRPPLALPLRGPTLNSTRISMSSSATHLSPPFVRLLPQSSTVCASSFDAYTVCSSRHACRPDLGQIPTFTLDHVVCYPSLVPQHTPPFPISFPSHYLTALWPATYQRWLRAPLQSISPQF
ncbi:hypothetical protein B0H16DRAFT_1880414 [Mycena metata]|uniref:Uncharacterized protein n=1 Tax=Mycena metata TaxID=1033252 RepID=A0AAD7NTG7_9AGAR|nr:hypothetical protein B0H16DRAFT_1880414 [Mycena metata]